MQSQFRFTRATLDHPQHLQRVLSDTTVEGLLFFLPLGGVLLVAVVLAGGGLGYPRHIGRPERVIMYAGDAEAVVGHAVTLARRENLFFCDALRRWFL